MIPKIIHYCWFGRNPKPKLAKKCIKSWKKYCPDYKIIEWNEDNFDLSSAPLYVRQAYEAKKWAFVTDYVRLWAMFSYGGIYMDTDVEIIKSLDSFLEHEAFSGFEDEKNIQTGIMACEKNFSLFDELLHHYDAIPFLNRDGSMNMTTNVEIITDICTKKGFEPNGKFQTIEGFALYPSDYFCPLTARDWKIHLTDNTYAIHHFAGSWLPDNLAKARRAHRRELRWDPIIHFPNRALRKILGDEKYEKLKHTLKG